jgi:ABC-type multidrug transport system fused ATPase/permease subunit
MAHRIIVMQDGLIEDIGNHDDLLGRNRFYQSLCGGGESLLVA